jgi:hypothetical protein
VNVGQPPSSSDDEGTEALAAACREISELRREASFFYWLFVTTWIAIATSVLLVSVYGGFVEPIEAWYDWPLAWAGTFLLIGIALLPVMFVTMFLHDSWWQRFGGGRRDARGQAHPAVDDTMRTRRYLSGRGSGELAPTRARAASRCGASRGRRGAEGGPPGRASRLL